MENPLSENWFVEGTIDAEYKRYILLAYLQSVTEHFNLNRLYPDLADLLNHYRNLKNFSENKKILHNSFPEKISEIDIKNIRLSYEKVISDDKLMQEIEEIVSFSMPYIKNKIDEGKNIFLQFENSISVTPVGILPLYKNEGYILIKPAAAIETKVYIYQVTLFESNDVKYRGIHTKHIESYDTGLQWYFEQIKKDLILKYSEMPNPATFAVECSTFIPIEESLLPIAKRKLVLQLSE